MEKSELNLRKDGFKHLNLSTHTERSRAEMDFKPGPLGGSRDWMGMRIVMMVMMHVVFGGVLGFED